MLQDALTPCKCGRCGKLIESTDSRGRRHFYISGHNSYGRKGSKNPLWKGGRTMAHNKEYICVKQDGHLHAHKRTGYVYEHILIMEKHVGRPLTKDEVVHHVNGNTLDNRIENLMLFSSHSEHMKHHAMTEQLFIKKH